MGKQLAWSNPELIKFGGVARGLCNSGSSDVDVCASGGTNGVGCGTGTVATYNACADGGTPDFVCASGGSAEISIQP